MCRTLLLNASPNLDGHSMRLAMAVLAEVPGDCEIVHLYRTAIAPCLDCGSCAAGRPCPIADDMAGVMEKIFVSDLLLLASPLHFTSLTAPLIGFFSRLQPLWQAAKRGGAVSVGSLRGIGLAVTGGGEYKNMFEPARAVTASVCISLGVPFAGVASAKHTDTVSIADNPEALAEAAALAEKMRGKL